MSIRNSLNKLFYVLDLFKSPFFFTYSADHNKLNTKTGIMLSLGIYVFMVIMLFQSDFYQKTNPTVVSETIALKNREKISFNHSNFEFSFGIFDSNGHDYPIDYSIFNVQVYTTTTFMTENQTKKFIYETKKIHVCTDQDFTINTAVISNSGFKTVYCLDDLNFEIEGFITSGSTKEFNLMLFRCDNATSDNKCKSAEEIDLFFQYKVFGVHYLDYAVKNENYEKPIHNIEKEEYMLINSNAFKRLIITIKKLQFFNVDSLFDFRSEGGLTEEVFMTDKIMMDAGGSLINSSRIAQIQFLSSTSLQKTKEFIRN